MPVPLTAGLGVADTATRLAAIRAALREKVLATAARLPQEPRLELKAALAGHLYDDARSVAKLDARLAELGGGPSQPPPAGDIVAEVEALVAAIDPVVDETSLRVLVQLLHRQRRHADELDPRTHDQRERVPEVDLPAASVTYIDAADAAARDIAEASGLPWAYHVDMARIAADSMRHAIVMERLPESADAALEHVRAEEAAHERIRERWRI
jgi:hypothetical protein